MAHSVQGGMPRASERAPRMTPKESCIPQPRPDLRHVLLTAGLLALTVACQRGERTMSDRPEPGAQAAAAPAPTQVRDREGVVANFGERVRLRGRYESREIADLLDNVWFRGPMLALADGTLLFFEPGERDDAEILTHEGREVEVLGVLRPPPAPSFDVASVVIESMTIVGVD